MKTICATGRRVVSKNKEKLHARYTAVKTKEWNPIVADDKV